MYPRESSFMYVDSNAEEACTQRDKNHRKRPVFSTNVVWKTPYSSEKKIKLEPYRELIRMAM